MSRTTTLHSVPICSSPLAYGGPSWNTKRGPWAFLHYSKSGKSSCQLAPSDLTCHRYSSSHALDRINSFLDGSSLRENLVLGNRRVFENSFPGSLDVVFPDRHDAVPESQRDDARVRQFGKSMPRGSAYLGHKRIYTPSTLLSPKSHHKEDSKLDW